MAGGQVGEPAVEHDERGRGGRRRRSPPTTASGRCGLVTTHAAAGGREAPTGSGPARCRHATAPCDPLHGGGVAGRGRARRPGREHGGVADEHDPGGVQPVELGGGRRGGCRRAGSAARRRPGARPPRRAPWPCACESRRRGRRPARRRSRGTPPGGLDRGRVAVGARHRAHGRRGPWAARAAARRGGGGATGPAAAGCRGRGADAHGGRGRPDGVGAAATGTGSGRPRPPPAPPRGQVAGRGRRPCPREASGAGAGRWRGAGAAPPAGRVPAAGIMGA